MVFSLNLQKPDRFQTVYKSRQNKKSKQPYYTNRLTKPVRFISELAEKTAKAVFERKLVVGGRGFARAEMLAVQRPGCAVRRNAHGIGEQLISLGERVKIFSQGRGQSILQKEVV